MKCADNGVIVENIEIHRNIIDIYCAVTRKKGKYLKFWCLK